MLRKRPLALALVLLGVALLAPARPLAAQLTEGVLAPAGRLRFEVTPTLDLWDRRFGPDGSEPLGFDLENGPLLRLGPLDTALRAALNDQGATLEAGSLQALVLRDRTEVALGLAVGVFDWLTVGVRAPLVKARTELAVDFRADDADVGINPSLAGDGRVTGFLNGLSAGRAALQARVTQSCPGPDCAALTDLLTRYTTFGTHLAGAYAQRLFVTQGSAHATALGQRVTSFRTEIGARAPGVPLPGAPPFAAGPLTQAQLGDLLTDPAYGVQLIQPFDTDRSLWQIGDVEVSAAVRLLEGGGASLRYLLGAQALARLPTGHTDSPDIALDQGSGDGQLDLEGGTFADVRWPRVGLRAEARYGVQRPTELTRRVAAPDDVFAPFASRALVRWTPGSYLAAEAAPAWYLTDEMWIGGIYRFRSKAADEYEVLGAFPDGVVRDGALLEQETEATLHELGVGVAFSTLSTWREGRTGIPFEVRLAVRRGIAGTGNTPAGTSMELTGRVFWRLWGPDPAPAAAAP